MCLQLIMCDSRPKYALPPHNLCNNYAPTRLFLFFILSERYSLVNTPEKICAHCHMFKNYFHIVFVIPACRHTPSISYIRNMHKHFYVPANTCLTMWKLLTKIFCKKIMPAGTYLKQHSWNMQAWHVKKKTNNRNTLGIPCACRCILLTSFIKYMSYVPAGTW